MKSIGVKEFPLYVKISQNLLQSSSIHLIPPFPKQARRELRMIESTTRSGAFLRILYKAVQIKLQDICRERK
jgi:hypothetical protein